MQTVVRFQDLLRAKMLNATSIKVTLPGIVSNSVCLVGQF